MDYMASFEIHTICLWYSEVWQIPENSQPHFLNSAMLPHHDGLYSLKLKHNNPLALSCSHQVFGHNSKKSNKHTFEAKLGHIKAQ